MSLLFVADSAQGATVSGAGGTTYTTGSSGSISFTHTSTASVTCRNQFPTGTWNSYVNCKTGTTSSSWSANLGNNDGNNQLCARSGTGADSCRNFFRDRVAPSAPTVSNPGSSTTSSSVSFTVTSGSDAAPSSGVSNNTCQVGTGAESSCSSSFSYTFPSTGTYTFNFKTRDNAGNVSAATSRTITYSAPKCSDLGPYSGTWGSCTLNNPTGLSASPLRTTSSTSFSFNLPSGVTQAECRIDLGSWSACSSGSSRTLSGNTWNALYVRSVHNYLGTTNYSSGASIVALHDNTAPTLDVSTPTSPTTSSSTSFTVTAGDLDDVASTTCTVSGQASGSCGSINGRFNSQAFNYSFANGYGTYNFSFSSSDLTGNTRSVSRTVVYQSPVSPPGTPTFTSGPSGSWYTSTSATFNYSATNSSGASTTFYCSLNGASYQACGTSSANPATGSTTVTGNQGSNTIIIYASNSGGSSAATSRTWGVDSVAPAPSITGCNSGTWYTSAPTCTLSATDATSGLSTLQRSTDNTNWTTITNNSTWTAPEGTTTLYLRATDAAGNQATTSPQVKVDSTSPSSPSISSQPSSPSNSSSASFAFSGEAGATFRCSLNDSSFANATLCTSPVTYTGLSDGSYTFRVWQVDEAGNVSPVASRSWTIDATAPAAPVISTNPTNPTSSTSASFAFSGEAGATFRCSLNDSSFANATSCTSPRSYSSLSQGSNTFRVWQVDAANNASASPASYAWTIDTTAPLAPTISSKPDLKSTTADSVFSWTGAESGGSYQCRIDSGSWVSCSSPRTYTLAQLTLGERTFRVRQVDAAGNLGAEESYTWIVGAKEEIEFSGVSAQAQERTMDSFFNGARARVNFRNGIQSAGRLAITAYKKDTPVMPTFPVTPRGFRLGSMPVYMTFQKINGFQPAANMEICLDVPAGSITTGTPTLYRNPNTSGDAANWIKLNSTYTPGTSGADGRVCANSDDFSTYAVGSTPDPPNISDKPSALSNSTSASFSFQGEAGNTFQCQIDGGGFSACSSPKSYSSLSQGSHTFQVKQIDPATEAASEAASYTWTVDSVAPLAPALSNTYGDTNDTTPTWAWTGAEEGGSYQCRIDGSPWSTCTSPYTAEALQEGSHTFRVRQVDAAGNAGEVDTDNITVDALNVDTTAPNTSIDSQPNTPTSSTSASFSFSSADSGATFECKLDESSWSTCSSPKSYSSLQEGVHIFQVRASDTAENVDSTPASYSWTVDTTAPTAPSITSSPASLTNATTATFSFSGEEGATFRCSMNDPDLADATSCTSPASYSSLSEGSNTFRIWQEDGVGNVSATPASYSWQIDTTAPSAPTLSNTYNKTNDTTPTWAWTGAEAGGSYQCRIDSGSWQSCSSPYTAEALQEGSHTFRVRQVDAAGNAGEVDTDNITVDALIVDITAPNTSIDSQPDLATSSTSASFSFSSADSGATFECKLDSGEWIYCASPKTYASLQEGSHTFQVRAIDEAENVDSTPASYSWTVDTTAPAAPTISSKPALKAPAEGATFAWSGAEGGGSYECQLDGGSWISCSSPKTYTLETLGLGEHTFALRQVDSAGNAGAVESYAWVVGAKEEVSFTPVGSEGQSIVLDNFFTEQRVILNLPENTSISGSLTVTAYQKDPASEVMPTLPVPVSGFRLGSEPVYFTFAKSEDFELSDEIELCLDVPAGSFASGTPTLYRNADISGSASPWNPVANQSYTPGQGGQPGQLCGTISDFSTYAVGSVPAAPEITANPDSITPATSASFSFQGEEGTTFECKLDEGAWEACTSPKSYSNLADGSHTFRVRQVVLADSAFSAADTYTWQVDTSAPNTTITSQPKATTGLLTATFAFSSTEGGASFECKLDEGAWQSCTSPKSYSSLSEGSHTFQVRSTDASGNTDLSPASYTWSVDSSQASYYESGDTSSSASDSQGLALEIDPAIEVLAVGADSDKISPTSGGEGGGADDAAFAAAVSLRSNLGWGSDASVTEDKFDLQAGDVTISGDGDSGLSNGANDIADGTQSYGVQFEIDVSWADDAGSYEATIDHDVSNTLP